jgi:hypothetical protein
MGGKDSGSFAYFRELCVQGFLEARRPQNRDRILLLVEMMSAGIGDELGLPCVSGQNTAELVRPSSASFPPLLPSHRAP